jgi:hypothetical protein
MSDRPRLTEFSTVQIFDRAAGFAKVARAADTQDYLRDAYHRLAIRYAVLAAEREIEEVRAGQLSAAANLVQPPAPLAFREYRQPDRRPDRPRAIPSGPTAHTESAEMPRWGHR